MKEIYYALIIIWKDIKFTRKETSGDADLALREKVLTKGERRTKNILAEFL